MNVLAFVLIVAAGVLGVVTLFQSAFRSLVGWAIVLLSVGVVVDLATSWSHTVRF